MNDATSDYSRRQTVTGRCRRRKRVENADIGFWTLWTGYLLEKKPLRQAFIQIRAKCRHRYATRKRKETIKIKQGIRTVNAGTQGPLEHRKWNTQLILEGNFPLGRDVWHMVGTCGRFSKTWRPPSLWQLSTYPNHKTCLEILNHKCQPFTFRFSNFSIF